MPGILPMKVIKVGTLAQSRIAQACDRCRSKKIRCDGIRPSCTQCVNVGFECKTSDKLSRRAFPRGYTESLEERVRQLESEVRDLKLLLDEKDEKIDILSRIYSHPTQAASRRKSMSPPQTTSSERATSVGQQDETFKVMQAQSLVIDEEAEAHFVGTSSSRLLIDAFKVRLREEGKPAAAFSTNVFFSTTPSPDRAQSVCWQAPARMVSDQLVNIFFQEWAALFPILHRPSFLALYEEYVSAPNAIEDRQKLAQLNLVFAVAAQSSQTEFEAEIRSFNAQWQAALNELVTDNSIATLQCLLLAQIACMQSGNYEQLLKFKGFAVGLSHRLGLHQSQKRFSFGTLTCEIRKKLFWSLYTLDSFSAAQLGLPRLLKEEDVQCEYPVDADDENITETGFLPTLPGECTKFSSALSLFKAARILSKVLAEIYPAAASYEVSIRKLVALSDELEGWSKNLPQHLRLQFVQDKPSTHTVSSRSPLLSLAFHYIRSLTYRSVVCATTTDGGLSGTAKVALGTSSKHIVQIAQLLIERNLSFSFCLNKNELLIACGFGLLYQNLDLEAGSALMKENQRLSFVITAIADQRPSRASIEYRKVVIAMAQQPMLKESRRMPVLSRHNSDSELPHLQDGMSSAQSAMRAIISRFTSSTKNSRPEERRATFPIINVDGVNKSQTSLSSIHSEPHIARSEPPLSPYMKRSSLSPPKLAKRQTSVLPKPSASATNLDYLQLGATKAPSTMYSTSQPKSSTSPDDWERLLSSLDNGQTNIYDCTYGGPAIDVLADVPPLPPATDTNLVWSPDVWAVGNDFSTTQAPQSVLSFSDESLTSGGDEFPELGHVQSTDSAFGGIIMPEMTASEADGWLDAGFGL